MQLKKFKQHCLDYLINYEIDEEEGLILIGDKYYSLIEDDVKLFNADFTFGVDIGHTGGDKTVSGFIYEFGGRWYIQGEEKEVTMTELKNIGEAKQKLPMNVFLGIHSGNELLNGVGVYKTWIAKAKFLGIKSLGICEKNTLAGVIDFQNQCLKNDIKPIVGMTLSVKNDLSQYDIKLYAKNLQGWLNLLEFNKIINIDEKLYVSESFLMDHLEGLIVVIDPKTTRFEYRPKIDTYYQLDTVVFLNEELDRGYIDNIEKYIRSGMQPISIVDAYYPEKEDWRAREIIWGIAKKYDYKTNNQYFKNNDQYAAELIQMFDKSDTSWIGLFKSAVANIESVADQCNFRYDTINRRLPKYVMNEWESQRFKNNEELFIHYIKTGFKRKNIKDPQVYIDRLKKEIDVLKKGDVIDYFLITRDIIQHSHDADILVGIGRGSAGGSLVSYLLGIIQINPLELDLLFERFLNEGRMGKMEECKAFKIEMDTGGTLTLNEGTLVKIERNGKTKIIAIESLEEGDILINWN